MLFHSRRLNNKVTDVPSPYFLLILILMNYLLLIILVLMNHIAWYWWSIATCCWLLAHLQRIVDDQHRTSSSLSESAETLEPRRTPTRTSDFQIRGRRIVDLQYLAEQLERGCKQCGREPSLYLGVLVKKKDINVCPNRIDMVFINYFQRCSFLKIFMKEKLLVIIRPNKIGREQLENVFLFVQIYSIYTDFYWQTTTNRVQLNIPNDSKTFYG